MPEHVVQTMDYWMNIHMTCSPAECDNFASYYPKSGGAGEECGYVAFPNSQERKLSNGSLVGIVSAIVFLLVLLMTGVYYHRLKKHRKRYKKRFVQQIARNIEIGSSPGCIPAETLALAFLLGVIVASASLLRRHKRSGYEKVPETQMEEKLNFIIVENA